VLDISKDIDTAKADAKESHRRRTEANKTPLGTRDRFPTKDGIAAP
jgi:hypothetical protein